MIKIGGFDNVESVMIGGGGASEPVIQTMWKDSLMPVDIPQAILRINRLKMMGCRLLRFAVPDLEAATVVGELAGSVSMPLVADIHFDYKIALRCLDFPIAKIRLNPGNIPLRSQVKKILSKATSREIPIRIGINAGSLPVDLRKKVDSRILSVADALVQTAERELALFQEFDFQNVVVSIKASSVSETIKANRLMAERSDVPLHLGVTEAGPLIAGVVRNTIALYDLLQDGIGDTIRVSLSDTMEHEVIAGREILNAVGRTQQGVTIISCPRCGRYSFDTHAFIEKWLPALYALQKPLHIAIMGCTVNGPGEARHADLGITGAGSKVLLFRQGEVIRTLDAKDADKAFAEALGIE
jgi:(E)-4-hydroxy-3-methylbut-2-enyl-diphosphate synthase